MSAQEWIGLLIVVLGSAVAGAVAFSGWMYAAGLARGRERQGGAERDGGEG